MASFTSVSGSQASTGMWHAAVEHLAVQSRGGLSAARAVATTKRAVATAAWRGRRDRQLMTTHHYTGAGSGSCLHVRDFASRVSSTVVKRDVCRGVMVAGRSRRFLSSGRDNDEEKDDFTEIDESAEQEPGGISHPDRVKVCMKMDELAVKCDVQELLNLGVALEPKLDARLYAKLFVCLGKAKNRSLSRINVSNDPRFQRLMASLHRCVIEATGTARFNMRTLFHVLNGISQLGHDPGPTFVDDYEALVESFVMNPKDKTQYKNLQIRARLRRNIKDRRRWFTVHGECYGSNTATESQSAAATAKA